MPVVRASSFADPADVQAYRDAIARGESIAEAKRIGDNGIGLWGDDTSSEDVPVCALPREDWETRWGRGRAARCKRVRVTYCNISAVGVLGDTMPRRANIKNGAGIDLNPGFAKLLGLRPPFLVDGVTWEWVDDAEVRTRMMGTGSKR
jgi:hypothetical protein